MKFTLSAVIPTHQYANLQPTIEVEAATFDEAYAIAMNQMARVWNDNVESGKQLSAVSDKGVLLTAFVGGQVWYNDLTHTYTNDAGDKYLSGSEYAKQDEKPFDVQMIAGQMAKKNGKVTAEEIIKMWNLKSTVSMTFGTAIHGALQLYGEHKNNAEALDKLYHLHDHPILKKAVQGFFEGRGDENAKYEVLVVDNTNKRAGQIDRLLITGQNTCRVQDYKTNTIIEKNIEMYWRQLSFYANILKNGGWTVEGLDIFHWDGNWHSYRGKVLDV